MVDFDHFSSFCVKFCKLCSLRVKDDPTHVLFVCPALQETRDSSWADLLSAMPYAMAECFREMSNIDKVKQILSCYGATYILEWDHVYKKTALMVYKMYYKRNILYANAM